MLNDLGPRGGGALEMVRQVPVAAVQTSPLTACTMGVPSPTSPYEGSRVSPLGLSGRLGVLRRRSLRGAPRSPTEVWKPPPVEELDGASEPVTPREVEGTSYHHSGRRHIGVQRAARGGRGARPRAQLLWRRRPHRFELQGYSHEHPLESACRPRLQYAGGRKQQLGHPELQPVRVH